MISDQNVRQILHATVVQNELYKKTILASIPQTVQTKTQMDVLVFLFARGSMNMRTLSSHLSIAPEQTTRAVKALRENNLVQCQRNPDNRREVIAQLTDEGKRVFNEHMKELNARLEGCLAELDNKQIEALTKASITIVTILGHTDLGQTNFGSAVLKP